MNNNNNVGLLLLAVIAAGFLSVVVFNNNVSLKGMLKNGIQQQPREEYVSPFGPRPSKVWENQWEAERTR